MKNEIKKIVLTSFFIALGLIITIPFRGVLIGGIPAGTIFSPMHLVILISGLLLGAKYGLITGLIVPLLASIFFGIPNLVPTALVMSIELATYGFLSGYLYKKYHLNIYLSLISAMLSGRIIYLLGMGLAFLIGLSSSYMLLNYLKTLFIISSPAIIIQIILVPLLVKLIEKRFPYEVF